VEAKTFVFTVVEGASVVRLEERRKSFSGLVLLSAQSIEWLALTMENLQWCPEEKDFIRSFREGSKVLIVRRGANAAGRFLEVAVYGVGGRRGIIFIPEGRDGRSWRSFVLELDKISAFLKVPLRFGVGRPATVLEKTRRNGDIAIGGYDPGDPSRALGKDGAPSFATVLRSGPSHLEVERTLSQPAIPLAEDKGDCPEKQKLPVVISRGSENGIFQMNPLGKDHGYRCGSDLAKAKKVFVARDKTGCVHGETSAGNQLTGELNWFSSLLTWKSQLEKLKADVDQAYSRVCDGLLEHGPGLKPKVNGRKRKNKPKKKRRLRWIQKVPKPNALVLKDRVLSPEEGLSPAKGLVGSGKSLATPKNSGGLGFLLSGTHAPGNQRVRCSSSPERGSRLEYDGEPSEGEMGMIEKLGLSPMLPEVAGDPIFAPEVPIPVSVPSPSVLSSGPVLSIPVLEVSLKDPVVSAKALKDSLDMLTVWAGSGSPDSLVSAGVSSVDSLLTHSSGSGVRKGTELALIPKEEPVALSFIDKVRGFSGKKNPEGFLKAVLEYCHWVGITCDGFEGQLSAVFEAIIDSNDKKATGPSSSLSIKGTRELNRLACSVNYDVHSGSTSRGRCKGRAYGGFYEA
jgi:hypothetical protein